MTERSITDLLEDARGQCESRMAELVRGRGAGDRIPREWFQLNVMERRLRPLVHEASRIEGKAPVVYTVLDDTQVSG